VQALNSKFVALHHESVPQAISGFVRVLRREFQGNTLALL
jgi:hypothetical protein